MVPESPEAGLDRQVRDALTRLSDPAARDGFRQQLLAAMEQMRPASKINPKARAWRLYHVLQLRYVEGLNALEVQHQLAISKSQYYREHESAISALVGLLDPRPSRVEPRAAPPAKHRSVGRWLLVAAGLPLLAVIAFVFSGGQQSRSSGAEAAPTAVTLSVYAGSGQPGYENGAAAVARFSGPFGLSLDSGGTLYVADTGNHRIRKVVSSGLVLDVAGSGTAGYADGPIATAQFSSPNAVTVGPDGTVYVGDAGNIRLRAIKPNGVVTTLAGAGVAGYLDGTGTAAQFGNTGAVVADGAGNVYVPDRTNNVIRKVTPAGEVTTFSGSGTRGHLDGPADVAQFNAPQRMGGVDGTGNVYVLDTGDNRIRRIAADGTASTVTTGVAGFLDGLSGEAQFSTDIQGLGVDSAGTLYVMDAGNRSVRKISADGNVTTLYVFTDPAQTPGNIKVDHAGNLYLSDREHNLIYKLTVRSSR